MNLEYLSKGTRTFMQIACATKAVLLMVGQVTNPRLRGYLSAKFRGLDHASPVAKAIVLVGSAVIHWRLRLYARGIRQSTDVSDQFADIPVFIVREPEVLANRPHPHMSFENLAPLVM
jgi:hypothetical protein